MYVCIDYTYKSYCLREDDVQQKTKKKCSIFFFLFACTRRVCNSRAYHDRLDLFATAAAAVTAVVVLSRDAGVQYDDMKLALRRIQNKLVTSVKCQFNDNCLSASALSGNVFG